MARTRPNKRQRQAIAKARQAAKNERAKRVAYAEAIPMVRSNVASWDRTPRFAGVGYSTIDSSAIGLRELNAVKAARPELFTGNV